MLASAGSFAAIATLPGSPTTGAFLLMEAAGLGGPMLGLVLVPGLLAAGIGSLIFVGWAHSRWPFSAFPVSASIYRRLATARRGEAVRRARLLGLI